MTTAHEPRRGPGVHLSVDDLSALAEGAQPTAEGASEHLLDCSACRAEVDSIAQLLAAFETLEPPQLPQEVAIRIDAALTREASARASLPTASTSTSTDTAATPASTAKKSNGRRWWPSRSVGVGLASLAALGGVVALAVNLVSSPSTSTSNAASGSAAAKSFGANGVPQRAEGQLDSPGAIAPSAPLAIWVKQVLGNVRPDLLVYSPCLANPVFKGDQALRVVDGPFSGVASTLVVYPNDGDSKTVRAIVYAQPCTASSYHVLAQGIVAK